MNEIDHYFTKDLTKKLTKDWQTIDQKLTKKTGVKALLNE